MSALRAPWLAPSSLIKRPQAGHAYRLIKAKQKTREVSALPLMCEPEMPMRPPRNRKRQFREHGRKPSARSSRTGRRAEGKAVPTSTRVDWEGLAIRFTGFVRGGGS